jgi:hypothetical protein
MEIDGGGGPMRASKRPASDDHENDQRLTKKFRFLSLSASTSFYSRAF